MHQFKLNDNYLEQINTRLKKLQGFYLFSLTDVYDVINNADRFSLGFKKQKARGFFYGLELSELRRSIFNSLPLDIRLNAFKKKCDFLEFSTILLSFNLDIKNLKDVVDIGMGHGVYKLIFDNQHCVVVKETDSDFPEFFNSLLSFLGYPCLKIKTLNKKGVLWSISEYLEGSHLTQYLSMKNIDANLVKQLAYHACIGDVFGRGDRHFENYLIHDSIVYPLDISYLFYPENELWVDRYIKGGQAEFSVICEVPEQKDLFWKCYLETFNTLNSKKEKINQFIFGFFSKNDADIFNEFVNSRLLDINYVSSRKKLSEEALIEFEKRYKIKLKLVEAVKKDSSILLKDPLLYMYYYANKDRYSAFFLIDYFNRQYLFDLF